MSKYRHALPQLAGKTFLTDGGMETTLIFHDGLDLLHFASFVLLATESGRRALRRYYESYLSIARAHGTGFVLDTVTWRANPDWGGLLGYDSEALRMVNLDSVLMLEALRAEWETPATPCVINGVIGPRGDAYKAGRMSAVEAQDYHAFQAEVLAATRADMISAMTINHVDEAIGIARAAKDCAMPCAISFTVETDGRLLTGVALRDAIEAVDQATGGSPAYYMVNCAHPTHFADALAAGDAWTGRIRGIRANASAKSHAELDESTTLDAGDPVDLGRHYQALTSLLPAVRVLGGCCGTDHRHVAAISDACLPRTAAPAAA